MPPSSHLEHHVAGHHHDVLGSGGEPLGVEHQLQVGQGAPLRVRETGPVVDDVGQREVGAHRPALEVFVPDRQDSNVGYFGQR